ncbi:MAG: HDOD domain-containing protein [Polyangiaceae bacterium]|nr:HDOD domain-containing protein [Polyangiaceae bacterium]
MKRILFVDDEPKILDGLRTLLRRRRREWDMAFVGGGKEALAAFEQQPFDVIVSDMRMPEMDGATLLKEIRRRYPHAVRIVLTGHTEVETALRTIPIAHQFLTKPCDAEVLKSVIDRACSLQALLDDELIRGLVGGIGELPSVPRIFSELSTALADPDRGLADVAGILEQDVAMCAKVLQLVNSSFVGLGRRMSNIRDAVVYLGARTLKQLVLSVEVFRAFPAKLAHGDLSLDALQRHSLLTAQVARRIVPPGADAEDAFAAGILHDVGILILATHVPERLAEALDSAKQKSIPLYQAETELYGVTHAEAGAYLLGLWGLPYPVVEAVAHHHLPGRVPHEGLAILDAVHLADALSAEAQCWLAQDVDRTLSDSEYLTRIGADVHLEKWRALAKELARASARV